MKNNRPVFESFGAFVKSLNEALNEAESTGTLDDLKKLLGGGLRFGKAEKAKLDKILDQLTSLGITAGQMGDAKDVAQIISDYVAEGEDEGVELATDSARIETGKDLIYEYLVNGTVRIKGEPTAYNDGQYVGTFTGTGQREDDSSIPTPLGQTIVNIFLYNLTVLADNMGTEKGGYSVKSLSNAGKKGKNKPVNEFLTIDEKSLSGDIIQVVPYSVDSTNKDAPFEYGFKIPVWTITKIRKGAGETLGNETYTEVIPPSGNDTVVTDKPYNSSGVDFFAENAVEIGEDGMAALNAIISEFNSIDKIVVNGGASSKPTSRAGGNEKLAQDRMQAGINALNALKKAKVEQLKNAKIETGEAKVQDAAPSESDPKNQQVSFIISGKIKNVSGTSNEPTIITKVNKIKADEATLTLQYLRFALNIA
jgi:hypothetical protein